ncbi:MAG: hypothetical protein NXI01_02500 [Gammaproteobacteria bacterium]|nr:hypothetical protein [Gammaproteobacteria bacterium]
MRSKKLLSNVSNFPGQDHIDERELNKLFENIFKEFWRIRTQMNAKSRLTTQWLVLLDALGESSLPASVYLYLQTPEFIRANLTHLFFQNMEEAQDFYEEFAVTDKFLLGMEMLLLQLPGELAEIEGCFESIIQYMPLDNQRQVLEDSSRHSEKRKKWIGFFYHCFDLFEISPNVLAVIKQQLAAYQEFEPYVSQREFEILSAKERCLKYITREDLQDIINTYNSQSWASFFWDILLCGVFGRHYSRTMITLMSLLKEQSGEGVFMQEKIRQAIRVEPKHALHRLTIFAGDTTITSGTDQVIAQLSQKF